MSTQDHTQLLRTLVLQEKKVVTFKWLSRKLQIHVNVAKQLLHDFNTNNPTDVHAIYCIAGVLSEGSNEHAFLLVHSDELEATRKDFRTIFSIHVYSIQPTKLIDSTPLVIANHDISKFDIVDLPKFGVIRNSRAAIMEHKRGRVLPSSEGSSSVIAQTKPAISMSAKVQPSKPTEKPAMSRSVGNNSKRDVTSFFAKQAENASKAQQKKVSESKSSSIPLKDTKSNKKDEDVEMKENSRKRKSFFEQSDDSEEDDSDEEENRRLAMAAQSVANDDIHNMEEEELGDSKSALENGHVDMMDLDDERIPPPAHEEPYVKSTDDETTEEKPQTTGKRRGRRKVMKQKHTKNSRGFLVVEDVYEWESFDEDEPVPKLAVKETSESMIDKQKDKVISKGKAKGKANNVAQADLRSFWGKK